MERDFSLLDLRDLWRDAQVTLQAIQDLSETLWKESDFTWLDMIIIRQRIVNAFLALGDLPPGIIEGIATEEADLRGREAKADSATPDPLWYDFTVEEKKPA